MLARVSSGKTGIVEYLVDGIKSGRELSRDELDLRVCIDGNLELTEEIINQYNETKDSDAYLHITLSFGERDIERDVILKAYNDYKSYLMNAYSSDEYNVYAEIHYPKVKSYIDKNTGESVERFPHVHMVIPKTNLMTNNVLSPFGRYKDNIDYHDAIQESVNRKFNLESPYDNQRKYRLFSDESEFISRYKGDVFKGSHRELREQIFDSIEKHDIRTMADFERELSKFGEVGKGKLGSDSEYLKVKPKGHPKFIRLKESCFKPDYIERRELLRPKPSDATIRSRLSEWTRTRSHEMKHVHSASPSFRKQYYAATPEQQQELLHARREQYHRKHHLRARGRTTSRELSAERVGLNRFADLPNGLPSVPQRGLARANRQRPEVSESVLSRDEHHHLESSRTRGNHELRRAVARRRGSDGRERSADGYRSGIELRAGLRTGYGLSASRLTQGKQNDLQTGLSSVPFDVFGDNVTDVRDKPLSLAENLLSAHREQKTSQRELEHFRVVRAKLDPERLLTHFEQSHGLVREHYDVFRVKGGSGRIKIGARAFNVSDFCTQHMHMPWEEAKPLLSSLYGAQEQAKQGQRIVNAISFDSWHVTQRTHHATSWLDDTLRLFNQLIREEQHGDPNMALADLKKWRTQTDDENAIRNDDVDVKSLHDNFKRQQLLADQLTLSMSDLVATKDLKNKLVTFKDGKTGNELFRDVGTHILMSSRNPEPDHVAAAMALAAKKFGTVRITGTKEFKQQVIDVAVAKDLNIVFADKSMQTLFVECREAFKQGQAPEQQTATSSQQQTENNTIHRQERSVHDVSRVAQEIRIGLKVADRIERDLKLLDVTDAPLDAMVERHKEWLNDSVNTAGYKYVRELVELGMANHDGYRQLMSETLEQADKQMTQQAEAPQSSQEAEREQDVTLMVHGKAPYLYDDANKDSYFVELSNGETLWGVGLEEAVKESGVRIGDVVDVTRVGKESVTVMADVKDEQGNVIKTEPLETERVKWHIEVHAPAQEQTSNQADAREYSLGYLVNEAKSLFDKSAALDEFKHGDEIAILFDKARWLVNEVAQRTEHNPFEQATHPWLVERFEKDHQELTNKQWDNEANIELRFEYRDQGVVPTFNGKDAQEVPDMLLNRIREQDAFLQQYSMEELTQGALMQKATSAVPVEQSFSRTGELVQVEMVTQSMTLS